MEIKNTLMYLGKKTYDSDHHYVEGSYKWKRGEGPKYQGEDDEAHLNVLDKVFEQAKFDPTNKIVLDAGCGWGKHLPGLGHNFGQVIGIEQQGWRLKYANDRIKGIENKTKLMVGDIRNIELGDNSVDAVQTWTVLQHLCLKDREMVVKEFKRILKPGGIIWGKEGSILKQTNDEVDKKYREEYPAHMIPCPMTFFKRIFRPMVYVELVNVPSVTYLFKGE